MKKSLIALVITLIVSMSLIFVGCEKNEEYYKHTAQIATEFFETEEYAFLFDENITLNYNSSINTAISSENGIFEDYKVLYSFYEVSLTNFTYMFSSLGANLNLVPRNNNKKVKSAYENFENSINKLKNDTNKFLNEKNSFVTLVGTQTTSSSAKANLKHFKTHYKTLLYSAKNFYESFKELYVQAFLAYPNLESSTIQPGTQNLVSTIITGKLTALNLDYMFDDNSNIEHTKNSLTLLEKASLIKQTVPTQEETSLVLENLKEFLQVEKLYNTEISQFKNSLENFSFTDYYLSENKPEFLNQGNNTLYFNKINKFLITYTTFYVNSLMENLL